MTASNFDDALARLLAHEGGFTNHPSDPGGPTNFGITIHDYRRYVKPDATAADVRAMKVSEAKAIYRARYWNAMRADELSAGVDYCIFDYAVNSGTGRAPKVLQRVLGCPVSGRMDDATVRLANVRDPKTLIAAICAERLAFLQSLNTWPVFGAGWGRRVREVRAAALAMASAPASSRAVRDAGANKSTPASSSQRVGARRRPMTGSVRDAGANETVSGKAVVPVNTRAQSGTAGGTLAAGGAAATQSDDHTVVIVIVVVTIALAIGGWLFWRWRQKRRQEAPVTFKGEEA